MPILSGLKACLGHCTVCLPLLHSNPLKCIRRRTDSVSIGSCDLGDGLDGSINHPYGAESKRSSDLPIFILDKSTGRKVLGV